MLKFTHAIFVTMVLVGCGRDQQGNTNALDHNQTTQTSMKQKTAYTQSKVVLGVSTNQYGVWDDVEQYIETRFTNPQKANAMRQLALAIQNALVEGDTKEKAQETTRVWFRALDCVDQRLGEASYYESKLFTAELLNSEARSRAHATQNSLSGGIYPEAKPPVCDNE